MASRAVLRCFIVACVVVAITLSLVAQPCPNPVAQPCPNPVDQPCPNHGRGDALATLDTPVGPLRRTFELEAKDNAGHVEISYAHPASLLWLLLQMPAFAAFMQRHSAADGEFDEFDEFDDAVTAHAK